MQTKYTARVAVCTISLAMIVACSKKATDSEPSAPQAPVVSEVAPASAAPPPAMIPAPARALARSTTSPLGEERKIAVDNALEPGTTVSQMGVNRTAQLTSGAATYTDGERKFIRTASANFRVKDVYLSANTIEDVVSGLGGFVAQNNIASKIQGTQRHPIGDGKLMELSEYTVQGDLIVRVPSAKTQEFLRAIANQIAFLDQRNFAAHDAQFDLLRKQLEYLRNQETQEDLGQAIKGGGKLSQRADVISSRNETKAARDEAQIQRKEFEDQVAFSTINLTIYQLPNIVETEIKDIDAVFHQNRPSFFSRFVDAGTGGWERIVDFSIWLTEFWPFWIVIALIVIAFKRLKKRYTIAATSKS
jgi:hypothetical protein